MPYLILVSHHSCQLGTLEMVSGSIVSDESPDPTFLPQQLVTGDPLISK